LTTVALDDAITLGLVLFLPFRIVHVEQADAAVRSRQIADISPGREGASSPVFLSCLAGFFDEIVVECAHAVGFVASGPGFAFFVVLGQLLEAAVGTALGQLAALDDFLHVGGRFV
jgi:hypothetical protein